MSDPLVSIIIPCHNAGPYLQAALDSAFGQAWPHCEVVLVDDGSTDDSAAIARTYISRGLNLITQVNRGAAAARNTALQASKGEWIQFLDADDLLHPEKIARQMTRVPSLPTGAVCTARWGRFTEYPSRTIYPNTNPLFSNLTPREYLLHYASNDCMMHPAAWLLPRAVADTAGPWDERLSLNDDGEYFTRIVIAAKTICFCPDALSYYRSGLPGSLSGQRSSPHLESAHLALRLITQHLRCFEDSPVMQQAAADLYQRFAYDYYPAAPALVADAEHNARALGGSRLHPLGGRTFHVLRKIVGWKAARRLQCLTGSHPY